MTGCTVTTTPGAEDTAPHLELKPHKTIAPVTQLRRGAGNVTQPVCQEQAQTGGEVRNERKYMSLQVRKSTNLSISPAGCT